MQLLKVGLSGSGVGCGSFVHIRLTADTLRFWSLEGPPLRTTNDIVLIVLLEGAEKFEIISLVPCYQEVFPNMFLAFSAHLFRFVWMFKQIASFLRRFFNVVYQEAIHSV
jgi:hypothetical protein